MILLTCELLLGIVNRQKIPKMVEKSTDKIPFLASSVIGRILNQFTTSPMVFFCVLNLILSNFLEF